MATEVKPRLGLLQLGQQPPRTAAAQDESWERHGENHYMRMIEAYAFASRLERELIVLKGGA